MKESGKWLSGIVSSIVTVLLCAVVISVAAFNLWEHVGGVIECSRHTTCKPEDYSAVVNFLLVVLSTVIAISLLTIKSVLHKVSKTTEKVLEYNDLMSRISKGSSSSTDERVFSVFYQTVIEKIALSGGRSDILATSSFTPPTAPLKDKYFSELARLIVAHNADYKVIMAKVSGEKSESEWDKLCLEELNIRVEYLNNAVNKAAKTDPKSKWEYGFNFTAKRSKYHARMDFLIVEDCVFINLSLSIDIHSNNRGYVYIDDPRIARLFRDWFFIIWNTENYSKLIRYDLDLSTGRREFTI